MVPSAIILLYVYFGANSASSTFETNSRCDTASMLVIKHTKTLCDGLDPKISGNKKIIMSEDSEFSAHNLKISNTTFYRAIFIMIKSQGQS